ncbi:MAG: NAD-dependent epimerase/dehydratase family protein [Ornithinimicrobium sp.]
MIAAVLGAGGAIGSHVVEALLARGYSVRAVTREPVTVPASVQPCVADLRDTRALTAALLGSDVVVHAAQPAYTRWAAQFPSLTAGIADAAEGKRLVFVDNLYAYGPVQGPLHERLPALATDVMGKVRAAMAEDLLRRHSDGRIELVIGRASDYFGARGLNSAMGETVVPRALQGQSVRVVGRSDVQHSWSYLPDVGRSVAALAQAPAGQIFHLPVTATCTQRELASAFARAAGHESAQVIALPLSMHRMVARFHPMLRELLGTRYQFAEPFVVDDSRFRREVGHVEITPLQKAAESTVTWFRQRPL